MAAKSLGKVGAHRKVHRRGGRCVGRGIGKQVVTHLAQPDPVTEDPRLALELLLEGAIGCNGGKVGRRLAGERDEADRLPLQRPLLVAAQVRLATPSAVRENATGRPRTFLVAHHRWE